MGKINWGVRLRQKWFWVTLVPMLYLLWDQVSELMATFAAGGDTMQVVLAIVGTVFALLALVGFPVDTTTEGWGDSDGAMCYVLPGVTEDELAERLARECDEEVEG